MQSIRINYLTTLNPKNSMSIHALLQWQWEGYPRYHRSRGNLLLHIFAVPIFLVANVGLVVAALHGRPLFVLVMAACMVASVALQGRGHKGEPTPPEPFTSPGNAIARILLEQWVTFPRFVLSGAWRRALNEG